MGSSNGRTAGRSGGARGRRMRGNAREAQLVATYLDAVAGTLSQVTEQLRPMGTPWRLLETSSRVARDTSGILEMKWVGGLVRLAQNQLKHRPGLALVGLLGVGFLTGRVARI